MLGQMSNECVLDGNWCPPTGGHYLFQEEHVLLLAPPLLYSVNSEIFLYSRPDREKYKSLVQLLPKGKVAFTLF